MSAEDARRPGATATAEPVAAPASLPAVPPSASPETPPAAPASMAADAAREFRFLLDVPWETITIWVLFLSLIYALRDLFTMIFLTFVFSYMTKNAVDWILKRLNRPPKQDPVRKAIVGGLFVLQVALIVLLAMTVLPRFYDQTDAFVKRLRTADINVLVDSTFEKVFGKEAFADISKTQWYRDQLHTYTTKAGEMIPSITQWITSTLFNLLAIALQFFLSLIFSLLIVWDIPKLSARFAELDQGRFQRFYREIAPSLSSFGTVLGRAFQAQGAIAVCNTVLTFLGLLALGIPSPVFLSTIVFVCSFIPVAGMIISTIPIALMALQQSGIVLTLEAIVLVLMIHAVEAYVLNPKIMGDMLQMHPLIVLIILTLSEHYFGVWGLLLGVPISFYVYRYVIQGKRDGPVARGTTVRLTAPPAA